jgi:hypothetical protein
MTAHDITSNSLLKASPNGAASIWQVFEGIVRVSILGQGLLCGVINLQVATLFPWQHCAQDEAMLVGGLR